jgi:hypothetical protein
MYTFFRRLFRFPAIYFIWLKKRFESTNICTKNDRNCFEKDLHQTAKPGQNGGAATVQPYIAYLGKLFLFKFPSCRLSAIRIRVLAVGCRLSANSYWPDAMRCTLKAGRKGYACCIFVARCWMPAEVFCLI